MSDTTMPPQETSYPPLSEATENDVREAPEAATDATAAPPAVEATSPEMPPQAAPDEAESQEESAEELKARNARLARDLREQRRQARQLEQHNQALAGQRQESRDETMEREIAARAQQMANAQQINAKANEIYQQGVKQYGRVEFDESVKAVNEVFGGNMPLVIDTMIDIDNADRLIQHLADNPDIADQLSFLPPHKMGAALAREAAKISQPKPKPVSKTPPPPRPIVTQPTTETELDIEKMDMDQLAKMWDKRDWQRRWQ